MLGLNSYNLLQFNMSRRTIRSSSSSSSNNSKEYSSCPSEKILVLIIHHRRTQNPQDICYFRLFLCSLLSSLKNAIFMGIELYINFFYMNSEL